MVWGHKNCIYKISFVGEDLVYIGQTEISLTRWGKHLSDLEAKQHTNQEMQKVYNKVGFKNVKFEILKHDLVNKTEMDIQEMLYMVEYKDKLLNKTTVLPKELLLFNWKTYKAEITHIEKVLRTYGLSNVLTKLSTFNFRATVKTRHSVSLDPWVSLCTSTNSIQHLLSTSWRTTVIGTNKKTNEVSYFLSIKEAAEQTKALGVSKLTKLLRLNQDDPDLNWVFRTPKTNIKDMLPYEINRNNCKQKENSKAIVCALPTGEKIEFESIKQASRHYDISPSTIRNSIKYNRLIKANKALKGAIFNFVRK